MKDLTFSTLLAVFEEIFGTGLFWALMAGAVFIAVSFVYILLRDKKMNSTRFLYAELLAPVGAIAAILIVQIMTSSGFSDIGGPIDVIMLILIGLAGAVGLTILGYVVFSFFAKGKRSRA
ncbi:DUF5368 domain-containing protein [Polycladidibacter stylochi]|uniref:DUF5368 domain-containing protein n=1 Tax=Polycladidibacter stylochi TaxID=1807766 RepID=UPI00082D1410|nr:DUF5368 domain-containing protein [Pseudovibrio stylochi]